METLVATTTLTQLGTAGSGIFNSLIQMWISLLSNSTLVLAVVAFGVIGWVVHYIKRKVF